MSEQDTAIPITNKKTGVTVPTPSWLSTITSKGQPLSSKLSELQKKNLGKMENSIYVQNQYK